jgi:hypothetical protein
MFEEDKPADWQLFEQPSGLIALAENVENLPPDYYQRLAKNPNRDWVRRYVEAEYGEDPSGTAVFREAFRWSFHTVDHLEPSPGHLILVGQAFGRSPCSVLCQPDSRGRILCLEEVIAEDIGLETHVNRSLKPALYNERYAGFSFCAVGDPSGVAKGNFLEEDSFDVLKRLGYRPSRPDQRSKRRACCRRGGSLPAARWRAGLVIDRTRCPILTRAMNGAYRQQTSAGVTKPLPDKTHPGVIFVTPCNMCASSSTPA